MMTRTQAATALEQLRAAIEALPAGAEIISVGAGPSTVTGQDLYMGIQIADGSRLEELAWSEPGPWTDVGHGQRWRQQRALLGGVEIITGEVSDR